MNVDLIANIEAALLITNLSPGSMASVYESRVFLWPPKWEEESRHLITRTVET